MTWIYWFPLWLFAPLVVAVISGAAFVGLAIVYRYGKQRDRMAQNDVAGPICGIAGTALAVMLSFMVVAVWQEYDASAANVQAEVSAVTDLDHVADAMPKPLRDTVHADVNVYVDTVVSKEWPLMKRGGSSDKARALVAKIQHEILAFTPVTAAQQQIKAQADQLAQSFIDARRQRLFDNEQGIPGLMWAAMLAISIITIGLIYQFRVERFSSHAVMAVGTAAIIAVIFVIIAEMDYPFRGDDGVRPSPFLHVQLTLHNPTGNAGYY